MHKAIVFNGPPRSGKDTAVLLARRLFQRNHLTCAKLSIAEPIKSAVHKIHGIKYKPRTLELIKDRPLPELNGYSLRDEYIYFSESYIKPRYGLDYFGKRAVEKMKTYKDPDKTFFISDCGFNTEFAPIVEYLGAENILVVKLLRDSKNFENDSREYIDPGECVHTTIINSRSMINFKDSLEYNLRRLFLQKILLHK